MEQTKTLRIETKPYRGTDDREIVTLEGETDPNKFGLIMCALPGFMLQVLPDGSILYNNNTKLENPPNAWKQEIEVPCDMPIWYEGLKWGNLIILRLATVEKAE